MRYRRFTLLELNMIIDFLEKKIDDIDKAEEQAKEQNPEAELKCEFMKDGIRAVMLDLMMERKRRYEV